MAKYFRQDLTSMSGHAQSATIEPLNGLQPMLRNPVEQVIRLQDKVCTWGRRIIATAGLRGSQTWFTPDSDPTAVANTHPDPSTRRLIGGGSADLTGGCLLAAYVVASPSGETQFSGTTTPGGANGKWEADVVWTDNDGMTVTTTSTVVLAGSTLANGAQPASMADQILLYKVNIIGPPGLGDTAELRRWCKGANVQVLLYAVGGARIIDSCVFEVPFSMALEADDDPEFWTSHIYASPNPQSPGGPLLYPYQRLSETTPDGDPRGGTFHLLDVHHAQHRRLGPVLFNWSGAQESSGQSAFETNSTTFVELAGGGSTVFDLTEPGLMTGTGGYARRYSSNSEYVLRDRVAAIPVLVRAYASSAGDGPATIRVMTREDSYFDLSVPMGALSWHVGYGWLEVGINPDDTSSLVAQLFGRTGGGAGPDLIVRNVTVHYAGGYTPAA